MFALYWSIHKKSLIKSCCMLSTAGKINSTDHQKRRSFLWMIPDCITLEYSTHKFASQKLSYAIISCEDQFSRSAEKINSLTKINSLNDIWLHYIGVFCTQIHQSKAVVCYPLQGRSILWMIYRYTDLIWLHYIGVVFTRNHQSKTVLQKMCFKSEINHRGYDYDENVTKTMEKIILNLRKYAKTMQVV